jgi:hypothetical protein
VLDDRDEVVLVIVAGWKLSAGSPEGLGIWVVE